MLSTGQKMPRPVALDREVARRLCRAGDLWVLLPRDVRPIWPVSTMAESLTGLPVAPADIDATGLDIGVVGALATCRVVARSGTRTRKKQARDDEGDDRDDDGEEIARERRREERARPCAGRS